jgi:hypothetical protein
MPVMPQRQHQNYQPSPAIQHNVISSNGNEMVRGQSAPGPVIMDPPPMCTGVCITPLLKFTCFGSNVLYQNFACQSPEEVCCVSASEVQSYEASLIKNTAHFIDMKPALPQTPNIPNFIATKGQALGPHLHQHGQQQVQQQHPQHGQPIPRPHQPPMAHHMPRPQMQPLPHVNTNNHVAQSLAPQGVMAIKVPAGGHQIPSSPVRNPPAAAPAVHQQQQHSSPALAAGNSNRIESIHPHSIQKVIVASVSPPVSSAATPAVVIHQTQNLPPTESTMSLNSSSQTDVTVNPQSPAVSASASLFNTTLSSITSIITSITTSSPPPLPVSSLDPEVQSTTGLFALLPRLASF